MAFEENDTSNSKCNSFENINLQFRTIIEKMGIDEDKQKKLAVKMDLSRKIKTIISMQSLDERKRKIGEYLERIKRANSLMSLLSLHCSIENGNKTLFSIFMSTKGPETIVESMKVMQGEYVYAVLDFVVMLMEKYDCEFPSILQILLKKQEESRFTSPSFYKILIERTKKGDYEELFKSSTNYKCVCSSHLARILECSRDKEEANFKMFLEALKETERKPFVEYLLKIEGGESDLQMGGNYRLVELINIAEEKKMVEVVTSILESFIFQGCKFEYKKVDATTNTNTTNTSPTTTTTNTSPTTTTQPTTNTTTQPTTTNTNTTQPTTTNTNTTQPTTTNTNTTQPTTTTTNTNTTQPTTRKKIIKKKKDAKKINYIPIKLNKIPKEGTIFEDTKKIIFTEKELEVFEKKEVVRKKQEVVKKKEGIFPEKKNYALNILLSRIKLTDRNLKKLVLEGGDCDPNLVKQLLLYFPTEDELEKLGKIEQNLESERSVSFFRECLPEIEDVKNSLRLIFFRTLLDSACSYSPHLSTLSLYYSKILSSTALRDILSFVLSLGNILNPSQCEAFSLDSLSQILESQSIISLLRQKVDLDLFREDFKIILDIQRINFQSISLDFQELSAAYSEIKDIDSETKDTYKQIDSQYQNTLKTYSQAQNYLKEKIDEDFNREFLNIFLKLSVERCTKKEM